MKYKVHKVQNLKLGALFIYDNPAQRHFIFPIVNKDGKFLHHEVDGFGYDVKNGDVLLFTGYTEKELSIGELSIGGIFLTKTANLIWIPEIDINIFFKAL